MDGMYFVRVLSDCLYIYDYHASIALVSKYMISMLLLQVEGIVLCKFRDLSSREWIEANYI